MTAQSSKGSRCTEKSKDRHRQIIFPRPDGRTDGSIRHHFLRFLSHPPHSTHHRTSYDPFNTMKSHAIPWKINISNERTNPLNNMSNPIKISCKSHPSPVAHVPEARLMALCCHDGLGLNHYLDGPGLRRWDDPIGSISKNWEKIQLVSNHTATCRRLPVSRAGFRIIIIIISIILPARTPHPPGNLIIS